MRQLCVITIMSYPFGVFAQAWYDVLKRVSSEQIKNGSTVVLSEAYSYKTGRTDVDGVTSRTPYINTKTVLDHVYTYTYDYLGRITYMTDQTISTGITLHCRYYYNVLGQLYREDNPYVNASIQYTYDGNNNLLNKKYYTYTNGGSLPAQYNSQVTYTYGAASWSDLLTNYNGNSISYNAIGQPTSYKGCALTWNGTNLASHFNNGNLINRVTYNFDYDADNYRTQKKRTSGLLGTKKYTYYTWDNGLLEKEERDGTEMWFVYSDVGKLLGLDYKGTRYYYVKDAFDNVTGIVDNTGALVVSYVYDSWGKILSTSGSLASSVGANNPFRYRSYYYDIDIGMYYLISRYYDPDTGRFMSPDTILSDSSLFTYCGNDPINLTDSTGRSPVLQFLITFACYGYNAVRSIWNSEVREDMNRINWNPFNSNEDAVLNSNSVSFYKGMPVFLKDSGRSGSFFVISLNRNAASADTVRHEWGHGVQLWIMGPIAFVLTVGIMSPLSMRENKWNDYYNSPWEAGADYFGGVQGRTHTKTEISRAMWYLAVGTLFFPAAYFFLI